MESPELPARLELRGLQERQAKAAQVGPPEHLEQAGRPGLRAAAVQRRALAHQVPLALRLERDHLAVLARPEHLVQPVDLAVPVYLGQADRLAQQELRERRGTLELPAPRVNPERPAAREHQPALAHLARPAAAGAVV
jgi:hypothetical protein